MGNHFIMNAIRGVIWLTLTITLSANCQTIPPYKMSKYNDTIRRLYQTQLKTHSPSIKERVRTDSAIFLNKPYELEPLGEGKKGEYNQNPLYRTDAFDCTTFVSTVLALTQSDSLGEFRHTIKRVRYHNGHIDFIHRNHFTSVDWNTQNIFNGYLRDETNKIVDEKGKPIAKVSFTTINKPNWYRHMGEGRLKTLVDLNTKEKATLLTKLRDESKNVGQEASAFTYLPIRKLYDKKGRPIPEIFNQIPTPSVIEMVAPSLDLTKSIGTPLQVTHLGIGLRTTRGLIFRHASSRSHKVIDMSLEDYLKFYLHSKKIKGIHVLRIARSQI